MFTAALFKKEDLLTYLKPVLVLAGILFYVLTLRRFVSVDLPLKWLVVFNLAALAFLFLLIIKSKRQLLLGLMTIALALPFFDFSLYYDPRQGGDYRLDVTVLDFFVFIFLLRWLWEAFGAKTFKPTVSRKSLICCGLMLICGALSLFWAPNPGLGGFEWLRLFKMMLFCFVLAHFVQSEREVKVVLAALLAVMFLEGGVGMLQQIRGKSLGLKILGEDAEIETQNMGPLASRSRVSGTLGHANRMAMFIGFLLPPTFALALSTPKAGQQDRNKKFRWVAQGALVVGAIALLSTLSRAGWLAFAASSIFVLVLSWRFSQNRKVIAVSAAAGICLVAALVALNSEVIERRITADDRGSFATRLPMAQVAGRIIQDHPLFGSGIGNYREWLPSYHNHYESFTRIAKVHNVLLLITAEIGPIGLLAYLTMLVSAWWRVWRKLHLLSGMTQALALGLLGGLLAFTIHGMVDYIEIMRFPVLWFALGMLEALSRFAVASDQQPVTSNQ